MEKINVTKTFLPPLEEYQRYVEGIWQRDWLTNQGPLLQEFQAKAKQYLSLQNFHFVANGTLALQIALRSLDITDGEVITTPFSYVATLSSIMWEHCTPVFVDIEPETFCIDPAKIEAAITSKTKAIMPVHVFGYPCDIEQIDAISKKHDLKVIYDAAHCFGAEYKDRSLLDYGDVSTCSFHATKLFHTIEGGSITARDAETSAKIELIKRFGHNGDEHHMLGMNAKATEFNAAMGLCNLKYVDKNIVLRKQLFELYNSQLASSFRTPVIPVEGKHNFAYYPLLLESEAQLLAMIDRLNAKGIFPRRYFFPSLNTLPYVQGGQQCPVSEDISKRIMCLPLYVGLEEEVVNNICEVIKK